MKNTTYIKHLGYLNFLYLCLIRFQIDFESIKHGLRSETTNNTGINYIS